jgi:hypothetical protein
MCKGEGEGMRGRMRGRMRGVRDKGGYRKGKRNILTASQPLKPSTIELHLQLLDESVDNDYFQMKYGVYSNEKWGWRFE